MVVSSSTSEVESAVLIRLLADVLLSALISQSEAGVLLPACSIIITALPRHAGPRINNAPNH